MVQLPQAPRVDLQLLRLLEALTGTERARFGVSETLQRLTAVSPDRILAKRRQNWSLLKTSRRQLEGKSRTGWSPSTELSSSTGASQQINSFPRLAHLAGLETITCKRSSFTTVAVHCSSVLQGWALPGLLPATQRKAPADPRGAGLPAPCFAKQQQNSLRGRCSGGMCSLENKATLTSLNKAAVFSASGRAGRCLPSPGQTVFWALWGHVGGSCLRCVAPVLGSPCCYQELKSLKPVLFFSFFTAVLVEGPSSSTLRFLQPE